MYNEPVCAQGWGRRPAYGGSSELAPVQKPLGLLLPNYLDPLTLDPVKKPEGAIIGGNALTQVLQVCLS